jgi:predicted Zn-dependent peptidase
MKRKPPAALTGEHIQRTVLPNGVRILTERIPHVRSVSVGVWVGSGSRRETPEEGGISHFIEHLLFKGTKNRSAEDIAKSIDSVGGGLDAFTSKELVCFNTKVLDEHLPFAMDVLSDLVLNPLFRPEDLAKEKQVVLEEIKMESDSPDYMIHEILCANFFKGHALGRPILGTRQTVKSFDRAVVMRYYGRVYEANNLVVTAAGNLRHEQMVEMVQRQFGALKPRRGAWRPQRPVTQAPVVLKNKKSLEQVQMYLGAPSYDIAHEDRFACYVLNAALGGGVSSRLFQSIRERQGLAYAVSSELVMYRDTGMLAVYAATSRETARQVVQSVGREFADLRERLMPEEELRRAKDHLKGSFMLGLESTSARMSNLGRQELFYGRLMSMDEMLQRIEGVTAERVRELAREFFVPKNVAITMLGPLEGVKVRKSDLSA